MHKNKTSINAFILNCKTEIFFIKVHQHDFIVMSPASKYTTKLSEQQSEKQHSKMTSLACAFSITKFSTSFLIFF